ncbi:MAG: sensor histidine kinase [Candidatus Cyclobacteriaceae bacterium M3_2C_046]
MKLSDQELIQELQNRFDQHKRIMKEQDQLMKKLQGVNQKLIESETLKSNFLSNIRNEINNPFVSIIGLAAHISNMCEKSTDDTLSLKIRSMSSLIYKEAFDLDFQLRNIFAAADIEAGETYIEAAQVDVSKIFSDVLDNFSHKAVSKEIDIDFKYLSDTNESYFITDPGKLQIIIANLINNALEFSYDKGQVSIQVQIKHDQLKFEVKDKGIGISEDDKGKIFDRFNQLDTGLTRNHKGHGLGLAVTKALLELLNGEIMIESTINKGSNFIVNIRETTPDQNIDDFATGANEIFFDAEEKF